MRATVNLRVDLRIDDAYVPDMNQRLMLYRKVAAARRDEEIDRVLEEAVDRYGPLPDSVLNLADYGRIRVMADQLGIDTIDREGAYRRLKVQTAGEGRSGAARVAGAAAARPHARPACGPQAVARCGSRLGAGRPRSRQCPVPGRRPPAARRGGVTIAGRARAGGRPGHGKRRSSLAFRRRRSSSRKHEDPRAPGGAFERVGGVVERAARSKVKYSIAKI